MTDQITPILEGQLFMASLVAFLTDPESSRLIRGMGDAVTRAIREHNEHQGQIGQWENEGGSCG
jgi:hypothetical protein